MRTRSIVRIQFWQTRQKIYFRNKDIFLPRELSVPRSRGLVIRLQALLLYDARQIKPSQAY